MTHGCSRRAQFPLVYANDAFTDLTGYPAGDVLGRETGERTRDGGRLFRVRIHQ